MKFFTLFLFVFAFPAIRYETDQSLYEQEVPYGNEPSYEPSYDQDYQYQDQYDDQEYQDFVRAPQTQKFIRNLWNRAKNWGQRTFNQIRNSSIGRNIGGAINNLAGRAVDKGANMVAGQLGLYEGDFE